MRQVAFVTIAGWMLLLGQAPRSQQQAPQFRATSDLVVLDVSVLDKDRHPVRGLTASDFTITERGQPQRITSFAAVDVPCEGRV